jgi:hypothetical protein
MSWGKNLRITLVIAGAVSSGALTRKLYLRVYRIGRSDAAEEFSMSGCTSAHRSLPTRSTAASANESLRGQVPDHLQVQPERDPRLCPGARQTSRGGMSNWLYLIGSFCFVAGTLLNMVQR